MPLYNKLLKSPDFTEEFNKAVQRAVASNPDAKEGDLRKNIKSDIAEHVEKHVEDFMHHRHRTA